ncbi:prepilin-type N-terminal cleavage/methylation domain-containing protein [Alteromonas sp. 345S023]|uniref:Prepilin-type N-terminal cleavage/methylation domain-containing protein n=1 Tax=Alteromonas profundi TaxID=2696062 RepID=A0A7X5LP45_9ALTE|nr:PilW family protein [Alteromonas profundi]NDV92185.1 prepilin-type N-terminal cleavage/methylation domain-containing protein [Alteromonas profundi]
MTAARGFSLVELMITLVLGLVISGAVIQVLVSSSVTNKLNQAVSQVQEAGRFITRRLTNEFYDVGRYDLITSEIDDSIDPVIEAAYVQNHPIAVVGDFASDAALGSTEGAAGTNDRLMVSKLAQQDCTGSTHGYNNGEAFHVVNLYFVSAQELRCTGFDGRVLRGLKTQVVSPSTIVLLDNVAAFHVQYGVSEATQEATGQAVRYVTAEQIEALRDNQQQVVSLRWALLIQSYQNQVQQSVSPQFAVLNESAVTLNADHYYQVFTKTLALRNMKNFVRSSR